MTVPFRGREFVEKADLLIEHASELLTLRGEAPRRRAAMRDLGLVRDGAVAVRGDRILAAGETGEVRRRFEAKRTLDANGKVVMPGFVDPHTHLVFAGSRDFELPLKLEGKGYADILKAGGGILHTVRETRAASEEQLLAAARAAAAVALAHGTTTLEVKSGYGLDVETELKQLRVAKRLGEQGPQRIVPTFLGAHATPPEFAKAEAYVDHLVHDVLPRVAQSGLARFCDVFCERDVFTPEQSRRVLTAAREHGLGIRMHADELSDTGGASLAAELGCRSADHLIHVSGRGIDALAKSSTVAVLTPQAPLALFLDRWAPGRELIDRGAAVALASDYNPNCMGLDMQACLRLAVYRTRLTVAEAIVASTLNAAASLDLGPEVGSLEPGKRADLLVLDAPSHLRLATEWRNLVQTVVAGGRLVAPQTV